METRDQNPVDTVRTERHGFRVSDDLADMPVSDAELDVIEAFLMRQFRAVLAGERTAIAEVLVVPDSEPPQTHAQIKASAIGSKKSRGDVR